MKILILSCNTGEGHNSAARAITEQLTLAGIESETVDALSFLSPQWSRLVCSIHSLLYRKAPGLFGKSYHMEEAKSQRAQQHPKTKSIAYLANSTYASKLYHYIEERGYSTILAIHVFAAEALTWILRKYRPRWNTYFVATDYTCSPFVNETELDYYFIPCDCLRDEFTEKGVPAEKLVATGIPVSLPFTARGSREEARQALDLPAGSPVVLIMSGSFGCGPLAELTGSLLDRMPAGARVVALCGRNAAALEHLKTSFPGDARVIPVPFTRQVPQYMDACDVLITKAGGLTTTEAAAKGVPLVHMNAVPGCETYNLELFTREGLSRTAPDSDGLAQVTAELLNNPAARETMIAAQHRLINSNAARDMVHFVLETASR